MECCHFHILDFFSSYLEVSCFNFNFQVLWAWRWFLYFLLQSYSSRILKPTGCDVKLGGAIFISSIFFLHISIDFPVILKNAPIGFIVKWVGAIFISWIFFFIFPVIFLSFENCPNMLHCEVRWCHFCFLEFCCFGVYHFHFFGFCS